MTQAGSGAAEQSDSPAGTDAPARGDASPGPPEHRGAAAGFRVGLVIAAVFFLGLTLGAVGVGLLSDSAPLPAADQAAADPQDSGLFGAELDPEDGPFLVNGACLGAFNAARDVYATTDELGQAAAQLDAAQLDEAVRRLQPLRQRLEDDLAACEVTDADASSGEDPTSGATATARPTAATTSPTN